MIIGHGDIASMLEDHPDFCFFASGVSDSSCVDTKEFQRERELLFCQSKRLHLVYFSSLAIYHSNTPYAQFKFEMEQLIHTNFQQRTIVRLGNIAWGSNPKTLINYLRACILDDYPYRIRDCVRFVVGKQEFIHAMRQVIKYRPIECNIHGERLTPFAIVERIKVGLL